MSATVGGCRELAVLLLPVVDIAVASAVVKMSVTLAVSLSGGSAGPLGYPRVETPTRGEFADPATPCPPTEGWPPSGGSWGWVATGPAISVAIDSNSPVDSTCSPTGILDAIVVVVTEAESLGSKSSGSTSLRALALV